MQANKRSICVTSGRDKRFWQNQAEKSDSERATTAANQSAKTSAALAGSKAVGNFSISATLFESNGVIGFASGAD